jgi:hypothetical protein
MKNRNFIKRGILGLAVVICCAGMLVSCVEEEIVPNEKHQLLDDVIDAGVIGDSNDGNSNADGPRGKDHDVIDIDLSL